jgi:hypothetical protein
VGNCCKDTSDGNASVIFIPLWQRGIKGDFKIMFIKSPLAPLCQSNDRKMITKEGYESSWVLPKPITEGLPLRNESY